MKIIKEIAYRLDTIVMVIIELIFVFFVILFLYEHTGKILATVHGTSMEPTLFEGDVVDVYTRAPYDIGDIIVFESREVKKIHRIIAINKDTGRIFTKGDNNPGYDDCETYPEDVIGVVKDV